jgi:porphyrinogen peroxidase
MRIADRPIDLGLRRTADDCERAARHDRGARSTEGIRVSQINEPIPIVPDVAGDGRAGAPTAFTLPQFGVFAQGTHAHHFLEFDVKPGITSAEAVAAFRRLRTPDVSAGGVNLVIGFGADAWRGVATAPDDLGSFMAVDGIDGRHAPATQHDAWLWLSGAEPDVTWQTARAAVQAVSAAAVVATEQQAFTYRGGRDITGFIDGTANPQVRRAADVALVPPGRPGAGGSHVLVMRWVHDLAAFNRLPIEDQERVIGRTKDDSDEMATTEKPPTAHIARAETEVDGAEIEIFRRSVPYGTAEEHGLYFVAFSAERSRYDRMLARMFGRAGDGIHDRLTEFSRPVSGAYYFAPSLNALNELGGPEPD